MIEATHAPLFSLNTLGIIFPILAIVGSIFTFVYSIKFVLHVFFGKYHSDLLPKKAHEASLLMLISLSNSSNASCCFRTIPWTINTFYNRTSY